MSGVHGIKEDGKVLKIISLKKIQLKELLQLYFQIVNCHFILYQSL